VASHTPNDSKQLKEWKKNLGWEAIHFWDFRAAEALRRGILFEVPPSGHRPDHRRQSPGSAETAPWLQPDSRERLLRLHEIPGKKNGVPIGPDMRLEPYPPLDYWPPRTSRASWPTPTIRRATCARSAEPVRLTEKTNRQ